jgi:hypothetical protein
MYIRRFRSSQEQRRNLARSADVDEGQHKLDGAADEREDSDRQSDPADHQTRPMIRNELRFVVGPFAPMVRLRVRGSKRAKRLLFCRAGLYYGAMHGSAPGNFDMPRA